VPADERPSTSAVSRPSMMPGLLQSSTAPPLPAADEPWALMMESVVKRGVGGRYSASSSVAIRPRSSRGTFGTCATFATRDSAASFCCHVKVAHGASFNLLPLEPLFRFFVVPPLPSMREGSLVLNKIEKGQLWNWIKVNSLDEKKSTILQE
jgi:hypothetical protein